MSSFVSRWSVSYVPLVLLTICNLSCSSGKAITPPAPRELSTVQTAEASKNGILLRAGVLGKDRAKDLLNTNVAGRSVLPLLFVVKNETQIARIVTRDNFSLKINGQLQLSPILPGRAATLLRNPSGSQNAAWAGVLFVGIFALPSIAHQEKRERAAVIMNDQFIFKYADIPVGQGAAGYLFFETPIDPDECVSLELKLTLPFVVDSDAVPLELVLLLNNPYV